MLVYVVKVGEPDYARYTEPFLRAYCRRHDYPLVFGSMRWDASRHPSWEKLMVHRFVEAKFVLTMDLDLVPLPHAGPIADQLDFNSLNLVSIRPTASSQRRLAARGYDPDTMRWNMGLLGYPKHFATLLEGVYEQANLDQEVWWEQGAVNQALAQGHVPVHALPGEWNTWVRGNVDPARTDVQYVHFAGNKANRLANAKALFEHFYSDVAVACDST